MENPLGNDDLSAVTGQRVIIRNAKAGCYAEDLLTQQVRLESIVEVNGAPLHIEGITAT